MSLGATATATATPTRHAVTICGVCGDLATYGSIGIMVIGVDRAAHAPQPCHGLMSCVERGGMLSKSGLPVFCDGWRENRRKERPETAEPVDTVSLRENIPFVAFTGIIGASDMGWTFGHGGGEQGLLCRMVVTYGKEKVPEEGELLLPGRGVDGVEMLLNGSPGGVGCGVEPLLSKLVVDAVVNGVDPVGKVLEVLRIEGIFFIVIRQGGTTELTGQDVGEGLEEGGEGGGVFCGRKGDFVEELPAGWAPEARIHIERVLSFHGVFVPLE